MTTVSREKLMAKAAKAAEDAIGKRITIQKRKAKPGTSGIIITNTIEACVVFKVCMRQSSMVAKFHVLVRGEWFTVSNLPA